LSLSEPAAGIESESLRMPTTTVSPPSPAPRGRVRVEGPESYRD